MLSRINHWIRYFSHHSSLYQKFYTNRDFKKLCSKCGKPNILLQDICTFCQSPISDADIQCVKSDILIESILKRASATSCVSSPTSSKCFDKPLESLIHKETSPDKISDRSELVEYFRCFEFLIVKNPYPVAYVHLLAVPKSCIYDIKQLRKTHFPLLAQMRNVASSIVEKELTLKDKTKNDQSEEKRRQLMERIIYGLSYPSEYLQLHMHVIVPPIYTFQLFKSPYFYTLTKVIEDIQSYGHVKPYTPLQITNSLKKDLILDEVLKINQSVKSVIMKDPY